MVQWLEGGDNSPSDLEAWGEERNFYYFKDLEEFLWKQGTLSENANVEEVRYKGKGKKKEKAKGKAKGKGASLKQK